MIFALLHNYLKTPLAQFERNEFKIMIFALLHNYLKTPLAQFELVTRSRN